MNTLESAHPPEQPRTAAKCERCRLPLARAGALLTTPCGRCAALLDGAGVELMLASSPGARS